MNEYLTWEFLANFAGVVTAVTILIQFLKLPLDKFLKVPTRFWVYGMSTILLFITEYFTKGIVLAQIPLILLNGVLVAMSAMGTYELTFKKLENK